MRPGEELAEDSRLTAVTELERIHVKCALDRLNLEMNTRLRRLKDLDDKFGVSPQLS